MSEERSLKLRIILVEPASEGNVGSVCRAMKNFGQTDLYLVRPCKTGDFARAMASHAQDLLDRAVIVDSLAEALNGVNIVVGTTGKPGSSFREHNRMPYFGPSELRAMLEDKEGLVAIVFGREDHGLNNEEIARSDIILTIPASDEYPVLNLSHAVAVVLYELSELEGGTFLLASGELTEVLYHHFEHLLESVNYSDHKRGKTLLMIRRILGRAMLTNREYYTLMGVMREIELAIQRSGEVGDTSWVEKN